MLVSSDLAMTGENKFSKKWENKREGPKIVPMKHKKGLRLYLTEN